MGVRNDEHIQQVGGGCIYTGNEAIVHWFGIVSHLTQPLLSTLCFFLLSVRFLSVCFLSVTPSHHRKYRINQTATCDLLLLCQLIRASSKLSQSLAPSFYQVCSFAYSICPTQNNTDLSQVVLLPMDQLQFRHCSNPSQKMAPPLTQWFKSGGECMSKDTQIARRLPF